VVKFRHIEFEHPLLPTAHLEQSRDYAFPPAHRLAKCGTVVSALYSRELAQTDLEAKTSWGRFILREDGQPFEPGSSPALGDLGMGEVHEVPAPMHLLDLPDDQRRRDMLEFLHEHMLILATARGWQKAPLEAAHLGVVQNRYEYSLTAAPKSSPDRRHKATLTLTIDGQGDAWLQVVFSDKAGNIVHRSSPIPTDESQRNFNAAKRAMRWLDDRTVKVEPWPITPNIEPLPDWTDPRTVRLS
jgi:hypothetical protein